MTTKEQILKAAGTVFEKYGFKKASMADIAYEARKGRRTIYAHFNSKEEIFKAVLDKEIQTLGAKLDEIADQPESPEEKLRSYMHVRMNTLKELTVYYDAVRQDLLHNLDMVEKVREEYDNREIERIKLILDEGNEAGIFAIDDTHMVAEALLQAVKGFEIPLYTGNNEYDQSRLIDPMLNLFYSGLRRGD